MTEITFKKWWRDVRVEAKHRKVFWLLGDRDSHREGYIAGDTPVEEVNAQIDAAEASQ